VNKKVTKETHPDDDRYIVGVKDVVMTRDDSNRGWFPQEGDRISCARMRRSCTLMPVATVAFLSMVNSRKANVPF
jgi:hypothetical protein